MINFIFMLTHHDSTVADALEVYGQTRGTGLRYIGFKDIGADTATLSSVTRAAHDDGLEVMLEVVSTTREDEVRSLQAAAEIGVDWVLGGSHPDAGVEILAARPARYCPFPGEITGHPSVLGGSQSQILQHTRELTAMSGVDGVDLLAYRHPSIDPVELTRAVVAASAGPVIVAGSIATPRQICDIADAGAWGFTIGGAIFDGQLSGTPSVRDQIKAVLAVSDGSAPGPKP